MFIYDCSRYIESKGRMLHLLKEKSKVGIAHKERKKFDPFMPEKRIKLNESFGSARSGAQSRQKEEEKKPETKQKIKPTVLEHFDSTMGK